MKIFAIINLVLLSIRLIADIVKNYTLDIDILLALIFIAIFLVNF